MTTWVHGMKITDEEFVSSKFLKHMPPEVRAFVDKLLLVDCMTVSCEEFLSVAMAIIYRAMVEEKPYDGVGKSFVEFVAATGAVKCDLLRGILSSSQEIIGRVSKNSGTIDLELQRVIAFLPSSGYISAEVKLARKHLIGYRENARQYSSDLGNLDYVLSRSKNMCVAMLEAIPYLHESFGLMSNKERTFGCPIDIGFIERLATTVYNRFEWAEKCLNDWGMETDCLSRVY